LIGIKLLNRIFSNNVHQYYHLTNIAFYCCGCGCYADPILERLWPFKEFSFIIIYYD